MCVLECVISIPNTIIPIIIIIIIMISRDKLKLFVLSVVPTCWSLPSAVAPVTSFFALTLHHA